MGVKQDRGDRIIDEHRCYISRDEGVEPAEMHATERTSGDQDISDQYAKHDRKSHPFLRGSWRQARKEKLLFVRDDGFLYRSDGGRVHLSGAPAISRCRT